MKTTTNKFAVVLFCAFSASVSVSAHGARSSWQKPPTPAGVTAHDVEYELDGRPYTGYVAYPSAAAASPLPGVLVAHQWMGLGAMEQFRAEEMATFGYFAFALDVYGSGVRPSTPTEADGNSSALKADVPEFHKRVVKGVDMLAHTLPAATGVAVNQSALLGNGYCFGGVMVLELARLGATAAGTMRAVASFHGELGNITAQAADRIVAAVQVHHADLDFSGAAGLLGLEDEMRSRNVSVWQTAKYGNVEHGWTDPTSVKYNEQAAVQSHASMRHFYAYQLGQRYQC